MTSRGENCASGTDLTIDECKIVKDDDIGRKFWEEVSDATRPAGCSMVCDNPCGGNWDYQSGIVWNHDKNGVGSEYTKTYWNYKYCRPAAISNREGITLQILPSYFLFFFSFQIFQHINYF